MRLKCSWVSLAAFAAVGCDSLVHAPRADLEAGDLAGASAPNGGIPAANRPLPPRGGEVSGKPASLVQERLFSCEDEPVTYTPQRIWRLSGDQWRRNAYDLAGSSNARGVSDPFGFTPSGATFNNYAAAFSVAESQLAGVLSSGRNAAIAALNDNKFRGCARDLYRDAVANGEPSDPLEQFDAGCAGGIINFAFDKLIQRDPTEQERDELTAAMLMLVGTLGVERGIVTSMAMTFGLPDALFRREIGVVDGDRATLTPHELAASIAYTLRRESAGRARILDEAENGSIMDKDVRSALIDELADPADAAFASNMRDFILEYFKYGVGSGIQKDGQRASEFLEAFRTLDIFVKHAINEDTDFLSRMLSGIEMFDKGFTLENTERLADDPQRPGILTRKAWLWSWSQNDHNDPIRRGHFIREHLLCQEIPEIPIDVIPQLPDDEGATLRERLAEHSSNSGCAACHNLMDPLALPLEQFDDFGRYRTEEKGRPVDTSGAFIATRTLDGEIEGPGDLATSLANSVEVERCFVRHLFRYLVGRDETYGDACTLEAAHNAYRASGGSLQAVVETIVSSDTFLYRSVDMGEAP
ncbi:MAG: DUF1588 domain-containing protein [Myxococcota bacterium]